MTNVKKLNNNQTASLFKDMVNNNLKRLGRFEIGDYTINIIKTDKALRCRERQALFRLRNRENGLCDKCGKEREDKNYLRCERCRVLDRSYKRK